MALDIVTILDKVQSYAAATGFFDRVGTHEPKSAPGNGLTCAIWVQDIAPIRSSGLNSTSGRLAFNVRLYNSMLAEPQDQIDPNLMKALDALFTSYSGDFDLGGNVRHVDLLGAYGQALSAQAGYMNQDGKVFRVFVITLPLIIDDIWAQLP